MNQTQMQMILNTNDSLIHLIGYASGFPGLMALKLMAPMLVSEAADRKVFPGEQIFKDQTLSSPEVQGCIGCHNPRHGFSDPDSLEPTSEGLIEGRFGSRNAPTILYAASSREFHFDTQQGLFIGGQFDDGRSINLAAQAGQPFLSPLEMNNQNAAEVEENVNHDEMGNLRLTEQEMADLEAFLRTLSDP